jgi:glycosyltransferase involved in cell wall biosynthesis
VRAQADGVDVSVLTPVLNEEEHIADAADAMLAQRFDGECEFLFIDGRSSDRTAEIVRELAQRDPRVRLLDNPEVRTPNALNIGLRAARGEYIVRMDAHTHYPPDYIARGVARLERGGADHVSGPQLPRGAGPWSRRVALALGTRLGTGGASFRHASGDEIEVASGFTGVWTRTTLDRHGGWDEGWPVNQDAELAARIRADGGRLVCLPEMAADYVPRESLRALGRQYFRYGVYRAKTSRRHPESMTRAHVLPPLVALTVAAAVGGPRPLRGLARLGVLLYAGALGLTAVRTADEGGADAAWVPVVLAFMHLPWGAGFVWSSVRDGPPVAALKRIARLSE